MLFNPGCKNFILCENVAKGICYQIISFKNSNKKIEQQHWGIFHQQERKNGWSQKQGAKTQRIRKLFDKQTYSFRWDFFRETEAMSSVRLMRTRKIKTRCNFPFNGQSGSRWKKRLLMLWLKNRKTGSYQLRPLLWNPVDSFREDNCWVESEEKIVSSTFRLFGPIRLTMNYETQNRNSIKQNPIPSANV